MTVIELVELMTAFHGNVRRENTGDHEKFACKLGISKSTLYNMINDLKVLGIDIRYSRTRQTYYYSDPDEVEIHLCIRQNK